MTPRTETTPAAQGEHDQRSHTSPSDYRRPARHLALYVLGAAVALLTSCGASSALAASAHYYAGQNFGSPGSGAGQLSLLAPRPLHQEDGTGSGVAVNDESHDIYVADTRNHRVDQFEANGAFVRAFGWGVLDAEAKLETCTQVSGCRTGLSGAEPGELEAPETIAVDNACALHVPALTATTTPTCAEFDPSNGDVYVADNGDRLVTKFTAGGSLVKTWGNNGAGATPNGQLNGPPNELFTHGFPEFGIAVDYAGGLWVLSGLQGHLFGFDQAGGSPRACEVWQSGSKGIAMDGSGNLYVSSEGAFAGIQRLEPGCANAGVVVKPDTEAEHERHAEGFALDPVAGDLYVNINGALIEGLPLAACVPTREGHGCAPAEQFGEGVLANAAGLAVDPGSNTVYAANTVAGQIAAFPPAVEATVQPASEVGAHGALLQGVVNPDGSELSRCSFEYGEGESFDHSVSCEESLASIGQGSSPVGVQVHVQGLVGGTAYRFRLRATNAHGDIRSDAEPLTTLPTAVIEEAATTEVTASSAVLAAKVNPKGVPGTTCRFEYGTSTAYGTSVPCEPQALSGSTSVAVSRRLEGLGASTYHWRVVVQDENGAVDGADETFVYLPEVPVQRGCANETPRSESNVNPTTGKALSLALPDCRAYEMVTPPAKNGALIGAGGFMPSPAVARDGASLIEQTLQCFGDAESCIAVRKATEGTPYRFQRAGDGWHTTPLAIPAGSDHSLISYNVDTGMVLYTVAGATPESEQFYLRRPSGTPEPIGPIQDLPGLPLSKLTNAPPVTSDFSHLVYQLPKVWSFDQTEPAAEAIYEYSGFGNSAPQLVAVTGPAGSTSLIGVCGARLGAYDQPVGRLAADGRTVFFTVLPCATGSGANAGVPVPADTLYERIDGARTVMVSGSAPASECDSACQAEPPARASFRGAAADGSRAFFLDTRRLTNSASEDAADTAGNCQSAPPSATGCNLYEFECPNHCEEAAAKHLVDVSAPAAAGEGPRVQGVVGISPDGSHVYFVAKGVLTNGANPEGKEPREGGENLYAFERDGEQPAGRLTFIATLSPSDGQQWGQPGSLANVTPEGRFLVFTSHRALTHDVTRREGPAQVYRFDAQSRQLLRLSVGARGFNDNGNVGVGDANIVAALNSISRGQPAEVASPTMSNDGSFVFFESPVALTPGALEDRHVTGNANVLAQNIYEWESTGNGGCEQPGGCVSLISDGRDLVEGSKAVGATKLIGSDASGSNVFIETADQLVPGDTDTQVDYYDARVGGGFPAPAVTVPCEGQGCREAPSAPSVFGALASQTLTGAGNLAPVSPKPPSGPPAKGLTAKQKLAKALAICRKHYKTGKLRNRRVTCERAARKRYGPRGRSTRPGKRSNAARYARGKQ